MTKYGIQIRQYKGMYIVGFNSRSLGCTLLSTWDEDEANHELARFQGMTEPEMIAYLRGGK